jgi:hypothetical protein
MRSRAFFVLVLVFVLPLLAVTARADTVVLASAANFAVLGATPNVTNIGATTLTGSLGISPAASITGMGPGANSITVNGASAVGNPAVFINDLGGVAAQAQLDLAAAITGLSGLGSLPLGPAGLSGVLTVNPGVYSSGSTFDLNGTLTLDALHQNNVAFVFLVGSALTAEVGSTVKLINAGSNVGVYWVEPTAGAQILAGATVVGNFLAHTSITLGQGATITCGSALANTGTVTMINNTITTGCNGFPFISGTTVSGGTGPGGTLPPPGPGTPPVATPEPGTLALLSSGLLAMVFLAFRKSRVSSPSLSC